MSQKYRVGQVLFVVLNKQTKVIPCQVVEEMMKKTLKGSSVAYKVAIGKNGDVRELSEVDGEIFTDPDEVRSTLVSRATKMIERMVDSAQKAATTWYNAPQAPDIDVSHLSLDDENQEHEDRPDERAVVELPDGRLAKVNVKVPENFGAGT